ncbi:MAG: protein-glutamate O-methyltransferase CheR [Thiopseudomonas sp.]|jgi:type IV pilus assembly protein PilK|nr:protein-glutamate O-methyltransferase CheR [Thiopseudomonas sp.]MBP7996597.1 protein-glutamate O-methyltransferase CheR [Thiopseudomonas sp.]MBP8007500.1 protein-glutamate O-methyltransferase CheR [Thiopseudomonas sp.]HHX06386.1 protein-glutamate O-methyltransferase CheR [Pseudomonas sp.]
MQSGSAWALQPLAEMTADEFNDWKSLLETRSGMVVSEQRRTFLQVNLTARMRELGVSDYSSYYQKVTDGACGAVEWVVLLDRLAVQETQFFRHTPSFEVVTDFLVNKIANDQTGKPLSLWSVGCSSGEEVWSLAICAAEAIRSSPKALEFGVIATDISHNALRKGRSAKYAARRLESMSAELLARYFTVQPDGLYRVVDRLVKRSCFTRLNMLDLAHAPIFGMDVIFCQNVLIYFRRWQRREILNRLVARLAPGGMLVIGVGEVAGWQHPDLEPVADERVLAFTRKG